jgi:hypothetical protein
MMAGKRLALFESSPRASYFQIMRQARVAELVDAHDSKSCSARSVGSIPSTGTNAFAYTFTGAQKGYTSMTTSDAVSNSSPFST